MTELQRMKSDLRSDPELRKKYEDAIKQAAEGGAKSDGEVILNAAKALGYALSVSELEKEYAEAQELSEDELNRVTGGVDDEHGHEDSCFATWHCYVALMHTETNSDQVACLKDYGCKYWYNDFQYSATEVKKLIDNQNKK